ncbi:hypothetical protein pb186bvf_001134 [Paramecium bursaria]
MNRLCFLIKFNIYIYIYINSGTNMIPSRTAIDTSQVTALGQANSIFGNSQMQNQIMGNSLMGNSLMGNSLMGNSLMGNSQKCLMGNSLFGNGAIRCNQMDIINSLISQAQLHKVCELENYDLRGFSQNLILIKDKVTSSNMKGDGLSLFNVETKEQFKLNNQFLYPEDRIIWSKSQIYFTLQNYKSYVFAGCRIKLLPKYDQKLYVKDIYKRDEQIIHSIDKNFVFIKVSPKCGSIIYKRKFKIVRKIRQNIKKFASKDDNIGIVVKNQTHLIRFSSFQKCVFKQKARDTCLLFFDYQSNLHLRSGWGTEKDVIINLSKNTTKVIEYRYDCNNFAISFIKDKVLYIDRSGQYDEFPLQNADQRSEHYLRVYSDGNTHLITYECQKQYVQIRISLVLIIPRDQFQQIQFYSQILYKINLLCKYKNILFLIFVKTLLFKFFMIRLKYLFSQIHPSQLQTLNDQICHVTKSDQLLGAITKEQAHLQSIINQSGGLHRAFSVFIFDQNFNLLIQKRAKQKITFKSLWANSCCSHQFFRQDDKDKDINSINDAKKRVNFELGLDISKEHLKLIGKIIYKANSDDDKWGEHELDYIYFTQKQENTQFQYNKDEVEDYKWVSQKDLQILYKQSLNKDSPMRFTPWFNLIYENGLLDWWNAYQKGNLKESSEIRDFTK